MKKPTVLVLAVFVLTGFSVFAFGEQNPPIHNDRIVVNVSESSLNSPGAKIIEEAKSFGMTVEKYQKWLDYQLVLEDRAEKARKRTIIRARAKAWEISRYGHLTVTDFDEMRSSDGITDSVKLMIAVSVGDNLVWKFRMDESSPNLMYYSIEGGLAQYDQVYFNFRENPFGDRTKVSSWLSRPIVIRRLRGTWESHPHHD